MVTVVTVLYTVAGLVELSVCSSFVIVVDVFSVVVVLGLGSVAVGATSVVVTVAPVGAEPTGFSVPAAST